MKELQIIQTNQGMVAVSDEEIKEGDFVCTDYGNIAKCSKAQCDDERYLAVNSDNEVLKSAWKKILLTEQSFKLDGVAHFEVEDESDKANGYSLYGKPNGEKYISFKEGYKAAQSKYRFTEMDIINAMEYVYSWFNNLRDKRGLDEVEKDYIQSLTKPKQLKSIVVDSLEAVNGIVNVLKYNYE